MGCSMHQVANHNFVFSRERETGKEILLLAVEHTEVPAGLDRPLRAGLHENEVRVWFEGSEDFLAFINIPDYVKDQMPRFDDFWLCWLDEGEVLDGILVPFA